MDGLPQDLCCECTALLRKSVRFKKQVLKAQAILYDYHNRCAPFAIDGKDPELLKYSKSNLTETKTLIINTSSAKNKLGFHTVLKHEKQIKKSLLDNVQLELSQNNDDDWGLDVKNEDPSNFDDLSMHEDYDGNKDTEDS
ncbi:unnamed protein product [Leptosia nina]|uniref:ZAD domain-containing protein n=1 Tax=Leptosia nina TaxID=320188 RepID=A0AAV1J5Z8_9NEOP